jgi:hypothetical protein
VSGLTFWAQALDNEAADSIEVGGADLSVEREEEERRRAVSNVSAVVKTGFALFNEGGVSVTANATNFVIEADSRERDARGRRAPLVCFGSLRAPLDDSVAGALQDFAARVDRSLAPETVERVRHGLRLLKKKTSKQQRTRTLAILGAALLVFVLVYAVASRR